MKAFKEHNVGILTPARSIVGFAAALVLCIAATPPRAAASQWHPIDEIAATAEEFLKMRVGPTARRTTVRAAPLDVRLRLAACDQPLKAFLRHGTRVTAQTIVGVRCAGSKPWKVYVPVDVIVTARVFVASRALPRGHLVTADDLAVAERDVTRKHSGYITDLQQVLGQRIKAQVLAGAMLTPAMLEADRIVSRGQTVTLVVSNGGINIRMAGKALSDGALNQRIRVENLNSGRIVEGIVRSKEHVEILMASPTAFFNASPKDRPKLADTRASQQ